MSSTRFSWVGCLEEGINRGKTSVFVCVCSVVETVDEVEKSVDVQKNEREGENARKM